jgi:hypothetical protein
VASDLASEFIVTVYNLWAVIAERLYLGHIPKRQGRSDDAAAYQIKVTYLLGPF